MLKLHWAPEIKTLLVSQHTLILSALLILGSDKYVSHFVDGFVIYVRSHVHRLRLLILHSIRPCPVYPGRLSQLYMSVPNYLII